MAKKGGNPQNLHKIQSSDEARELGRKGGTKSGEVRRKQRDARQAMKLLLSMATKGNADVNLETLGIEECERTNGMAVQARLFSAWMATGNITYYDRMMQIAGYDPNEKRKDSESRARVNEIKARTKSYDHSTVLGDEIPITNDAPQDDVVIYLPKQIEPEEMEDSTDDGSKDSQAPAGSAD